MERVVGGKGSVGTIKNLPQFSHCQRLFLLLIILTHKLCPLHPHSHNRDRDLYSYKANPLEIKKRNTQKDG